MARKDQSNKLSLVFACSLALLGVSCHLDQTIRAERPRQLFIQSLDGKVSRQLVKDTDYVVQGSPDWSADGKKILFDAWREDESFSNVHMFIINADGTGLKDLGPGAMPNFSPDGKRFAYSWRGVHIRDLDGGGQEMIDRNGWGAQWSPDGKKIAFGTSRNVVIHDLTTRQNREILEGEHAGIYNRTYWNLGWSKDSKHICFKGRRAETGKNEVAVVQVAGSSKGFQVLVKRDTNCCYKWHSDGKRILMSIHDPMRKFFQLYLVNRDKEEVMHKKLPHQPFDTANSDADWSPDEKFYVFTKRSLPMKSN